MSIAHDIPIQQEEVALNRRRNKVDMEKIFATVISLAIMVALVVGVVSILKSNNSQGDKKHNYIDLNEINEALSTESPENDTLMEADNREEQSKDDRHVENTTTEENDEDGKRAAEVTGEIDLEKDKPFEVPSTAADAENTQTGDKDGDKAVSSDAENEGQAVAANTEQPTAENVTEATASEAKASEATATENPASEAASGNIDSEATPVSASTATILGYSFNEESTLMWPTTGNVILNYNMTNTIYFPTLDVYRCNPAIVIGAEEDSVVSAAADGIVISVYETSETGLTMEIALGDDYVMTYGQLKNPVVGVGSQVKRGDVIASVAAPSQYYTVEGSNLYFRLDKNGTSVNPMDYIDAE